jgi:hypothetical protein
MKNHLLKICSIIFPLLLLAACATTSVNSRIGALAKKYPDVLIVEVQSSSNLISNKLILASIKAGANTTTSDAIVNLLSKKTVNPIAVVGEDDSLSAATLERALEAGKGKISGSRVVFVGNPEYKNSLAKAANNSGVSFDFIPSP